MSLEEAVQAVQVGLEGQKTHQKTDLYAIGEMGIGNTTTSSAFSAFSIKTQMS